ncbi:hypothetical protein [Vibrio tritonius]|uniref:hypothetical protein n=1 Tax=Vibrio tritonius TaxID=1435069 RepID=UPI0008381E1B|nr:hypothetical protein [Vibrio tritonius]
MKNMTIIALFSLFLMACSQVRDRSGIELDLYPITASLSMDVGNVVQAKRQVNQFIIEHKQELLTDSIELFASNNKQRQLAKYTRQKLLVIGVSKQQISVSNSTSSGLFELRMTQFHVKSGKCHYVNYNSLNTMSDDHGCNVESNRWTSMTNPERSLGSIGK